jgi:RHS repeat-associated protein
MTGLRRIALPVLALAALFAPAAAHADVHPNTAPGFPVEQSFHVGDVDSVNLFNGALTLTLPLGGTYPVNGGFSYNLKLTYNSSPWLFKTMTYSIPPDYHPVPRIQGYPNPCSNAGLGWRVSFGRMDPPCQVPDVNDTLPLGPIYQDENGTDHVFYPVLHYGDAEDSLPAGVSDVEYTRDGSYLRLKVYTAGYREIEFPDGSVRRFDDGGVGFTGMPTAIRDPFGNQLTISYATPNQWVLTDTQGRTQRVWFRTDLPGYAQSVDHVDLVTFGGVTVTYQFNYATQVIGRPCPHNDTDQMGSLGPTVNVPLLTSVSLPDGSSWKTTAGDYVTTIPSGPTFPANACTENAGNLTAWTLPTLGRMEWTWQKNYFPTGSTTKPHLQTNPAVATRGMRNADGTLQGAWGYGFGPGFPAALTSAEHTTTVTDPLGHKTVNYFSTSLAASYTGWSTYDYSLPFTRNQTLNVAAGVDLDLSRQVYNAGGTLLRSEYVLYERDPVFASGPPDIYNTNRRPLRSRTVYNDDGGTYGGVVNSGFDGLGHYRTQATEGSFPGSNVRTQFANYNPAQGTYTINQAANSGSGFSLFPASSAWVTGAPASTSESEGGATAQADLCYAPNSAVVTRKRVHRLDGATQGTADLVSVSAVSAQGNVTSESSYGGDAQAVAAGGANLCTMGLPAVPEVQINHTYAGGVRATSQYVGTGFLALDQTIDASTGLPLSSRDSAGIQTAFTYDALGRMTWSKPDVGQGGWTEYVYAPANSAGPTRASVTVRRRDNGSQTAPILGVNLVVFDYFGRVYQEQRRLPGGAYNKRETLYDGSGNKASVSELTTGAATNLTSFFSYDPFGRPATIQPPDGASHDVTMTYSGVRQVNRTVKIATAVGSETSATTNEVYDRQGRLLTVTEPSGDSSALVTTTYGYDVGNRLASVSTPAFVTGTGTVTQSRSFSYDRAGLLQSETHPELGVAGNGSTTYPLYNSRGHLLRRIDGANDLTFAYDPAERLFQVKETGGAQRLLKTFSYANGNTTFTDPSTGIPCTDYRAGKANQQSRFNYVTIGGGSFTVELREAMTYCGRDGRMSRRTLENWVNGAVNETFVLPNMTYDALGNTTSLGYPQCTHAACAAPSPRTVNFTYGDDLLSAVGIPGNAGYYASALSYYPNLMVSQVVHTNNPADSSKSLTDTYANDPNLMRRPASISVTTPTSVSRWTSGTYNYDGAGNVKAIGTHTFTYDKVSRLTAANLYLEPTASTTLRTQTFGYDAFGNLLTFGGSSARNTPTAPGSNHLTGAAYDASGNVTTWNGNTYTYDPFHLMWDYKTPTDEWIYLYTAADERAWSYKTDNTSLWTLRGLDAKVLREYTTNGTWSVAEDYIYRDGLLLAAETPAGTRHFHLDHLGTPRLVSNNLGQQAAYHVYYPFGEEATAFNQDTIREKFTGHERDLGNPSGSGDDLDYMHARHESEWTGRFLSVDAESGKPGRPQTWNRFVYAIGNPIRFIDPNGQEAEESSLFQQLYSFFSSAFNRAAPPPSVPMDPSAGGLVREGELSPAQAQRMSPGQDAALVQQGLNESGSALAAGFSVIAIEYGEGKSLEIAGSAVGKLEALAGKFETKGSELVGRAVESGQAYLDVRVGNEGNLNLFIPRPDGKTGLLRITLDPSKTKVVSAGYAKLKDVAKAVKSGGLLPVK